MEAVFMLGLLRRLGTLLKSLPGLEAPLFCPLLPQELIVYAKAMQVRGTSTRNQAGIVKDQVPGADS